MMLLNMACPTEGEELRLYLKTLMTFPFYKHLLQFTLDEKRILFAVIFQICGGADRQRDG